MAEQSAQKIILERYAEKCRIAGGLRVGFVLRRQAILYVAGDYPGVDLEAGLAALIEDGMIKSSDSGDFCFLTAAGAEKIGGGEAAA